jgi:hypothetical protein
MELKQENTQLKKLVLSYADDLGPKIQGMENDTKRIHREYEKLQVDVQKYHTSHRPSSSQVLLFELVLPFDNIIVRIIYDSTHTKLSLCRSNLLD